MTLAFIILNTPSHTTPYHPPPCRTPTQPQNLHLNFHQTPTDPAYSTFSWLTTIVVNNSNQKPTAWPRETPLHRTQIGENAPAHTDLLDTNGHLHAQIQQLSSTPCPTIHFAQQLAPTTMPNRCIPTNVVTFLAIICGSRRPARRHAPGYTDYLTRIATRDYTYPSLNLPTIKHCICINNLQQL